MRMDEVTLAGTVAAVVAALSSSVAVAISWATYVVAKRRTVADVVTQGRLRWLDGFRDALGQFLVSYQAECYLKPADRRDSRAAAAVVEMFMDYSNPAGGYHELRDRLHAYLASKPADPITDHSELVQRAQVVLGAAYSRAKQEDRKSVV
jgi:hypothetical protein